MRLAIMQPYLFPYLGYFQLAAAVDRFVFYDDVAYIKNGWINRNRILLGGEAHYLTLPLNGASSSRRILDVRIQPRDRWMSKVLAMLHHAYSRAPQYALAIQLVERVLSTDTDAIGRVASNSVTETCAYLGIETQFIATSTGYDNDTLRGQSRVIDICCQEKARRYVNAPGGRALYDSAAFLDAGIDLEFIAPETSPYAQFGMPFVPNLSIIDVLMFNRVDTIRSMLAINTVTA
ncbi:WbqC family protein [Burkholderia cenocepacia]|uniref:WbqC family protein n=1 Tax=Burkholderia cenocepacia TaxID=95486 RepID=UPI00163C9E14|nr:WbqC family protein [Burkholderia cenocepacia]MCF1365232.1 WbqC family protein [Burkholderia cenocepacia]MCF1382767.1 WbqC family protein [Burkholderia cenocepacia]MDR8025344.1 WbqC family protein [Burkholderia cenocepacia]MDR8042570.1 WbqC family protein [Burkholderia cenocepacia]QND93296.1 WbqC-like protein family protein [Burkholderia cenocepacia]